MLLRTKWLGLLKPPCGQEETSLRNNNLLEMAEQKDGRNVQETDEVIEDFANDRFLVTEGSLERRS